MNASDLVIFAVLADLKNKARASKVLGVAENTISVALNAIEMHTGISKPFEGRRSYANLTKEGERLFQYASQVRRSLEAAKLDLRKPDYSVSGSLEIEAIPSVAARYLPKFIKMFQNRYPKAIFTIKEHTSGAIVERVGNGDSLCGLGIIQSGATDVGLVEEPLFTEELVVLMNSEHPKCEDEITIEDLQDEAFIHFSGRVRELIIGFFNDESIKVSKVADCAEVETVRGLVRAGIGISILPERSIPDSLSPGVTIKRLQGSPLKRTVCKVRNSKIDMSPAVEAFWNFLTPEGKSTTK